MTVEELEIIVTAKVEEAIKQFKKIVPEIKKAVEQAQESFEKMDAKGLKNEVQQAVQFVKKKIQDLKKSNQNNEIKLTVNNKEAQKQISQIQKEIDSLQQKINARQMKLNITNNTLDKMRAETNQEVIKEMPEAGNKAIKNEIYNRLNGNEQYISLVKESNKLNNEVIKYNSLLETAKQEMSNLGSETQKTGTGQSRLSSFVGALKPVFSKIVGECQRFSKSCLNLVNPLNYVKKIASGISNKIKGMGKGMKTGLKQVIKYTGALFSLRSIYSTLSSSASSWLSSQNEGAKQLSTNIDYMKNSLESVLAPVITYITNLLYNMMKAVQSVVYALFRVNIFANASSKAYSNMAGSVKKAKKESQSLASIHSELNNISDNDNSDSGSGSGGMTPSFDLSQMDSQMSPLAQKLYDFFRPIKESWDNYGAELIEQIKTTAVQVGRLIGTVWGGFENIITNGTLYTTLENILAIVGNIAEAFSEAWNFNSNGDTIIQNLANALNNLLEAINNIVKSQEFQDWLNNCSDKFRKISEKIAEINWQPLINALSDIGQNLGNIALNILSGLVDIFKWLVENPIVAEIILGIAVAIGILSTAYGIWSTLTGILTGVTTALNIALLPLIGIILGIIAIITLIVVAIMNWDTIMKTLSDTWEWIKQKAVEIFTAIGEFFKNIWQGICEVATNVWNGIKDTISNILNTIKTIWNNIWLGLKITVTNIFNGIWNVIKGVINTILGGIEGMANGVVNGVNFVIKTLNKLKFDIPDWVPGLGGKTFGFNIGLMPQVSLPRLAKGGVLTQPTTVLAGEYSGARSNPEIVTPQNIMYETTRRAIEDAGFHNNNGQSINLTIKVGNKKLAQILLEDLRDMTRQTGKDIEALVGG